MKRESSLKKWFRRRGSPAHGGIMVIAFAALISVGIFGGYGVISPVRPADAASSLSTDIPRPPKVDPYWLTAQREVDRSVGDMLKQHEAELERGVRYSKLMHGDRNRKRIAITFDDGPHPKYTPQILSILKANNVRATFFLVGEMAVKYPWLVNQELGSGMAIGNHTYHHVNLTKIPEAQVATEIKACGDVLYKITHQKDHLIFRPPGGDYNSDVAEAATALGYKMILWTDDPGDYASPGKKVIQTRLLDKVSNGGIILIHDGIQQTIDVLPGIIKQLRAKGFELVTIPEMLEAKREARVGK